MSEALQTTLNLFLLFSLFAFSVLMGVLLFFRLQRFHSLAHLLGGVLPFVLFIFFSWLIFVYRYYRAHPDDSCGGQLIGALGIVSLGTVILLVVSPLAQWLVHVSSHSCSARSHQGARF